MSMGYTTLQINLNSQRMVDLAQIKKQRKIPSDPKSPGFLSDDLLAKALLMERIDELLKVKA
jgi:hypothetical protein